MVKRKILIVAGSFYPSNSPRAFRTTELAQELARQGHAVSVYFPTGGIDYSTFERDTNVRIKDLGKLRFPEIKAGSNRFTKIFYRGLRRLLLLLFEYPGIELMFKVKKVLKKESGYDLLISIAVPYPIHWGVAWVRSEKRRIAKTWVADCGDPYMFCKTDSFKKLFYFGFLEKWAFRKADFISLPNQDHQGQYNPEFIPKMKFIPQGFRFEDSKVFTGFVNNKVPTFAFAGVFLKEKRDPTFLLEFLATLNIDFKFVIFSSSEALIRPFIPILKNKIDYRGFVPRDELIYNLSQMDFLVNIEFHSSVGSNSPSKLIDYAITKRPVLSISMENFDKQKVVEFLNGNYSNRLELKNIDQFRVENVASQFIQLTGN